MMKFTTCRLYSFIIKTYELVELPWIGALLAFLRLDMGELIVYTVVPKLFANFSKSIPMPKLRPNITISTSQIITKQNHKMLAFGILNGTSNALSDIVSGLDLYFMGPKFKLNWSIYIHTIPPLGSQ